MIELAPILAWSALAVIVTITPGPDTLLVATHGARGGFRAGLAAVAGIQAGALWYAVLCGFGALSLLTAVPMLFLIVKVIGAVYLAWLGAGMLARVFAKRDPAEQKEQSAAQVHALHPARASLAVPFRQAFLTNVLNPKVALFYLAALPQFASGPNAPMMGVLLIAIHAVFGATWLSGVAFAASRARAIAWNSKFTRWLEGAIGAFFVSVAGRLALFGR